MGLVRYWLKLPPFVIVSHQANKSGKVVFCNNLMEVLSNQNYAHENNLAVFLENADGTEEIPENVSVVVLRHDLP